MAKLVPFKAVRPTRAIVGLVAARSYQSYTIDERDSRMDYNPYTFLHIVNPGYKYAQVITGEERYNLVRNRYLEFKEDNVFITDDKPSFYVYKIVNRHNQTFNGIIAASSAEDYENDIIKKHEDTIESREETFKSYLNTVKFNAEPVLLTYPDNKKITEIIKKVQKKHAEFEFTMTYKDTHYLWKIDDESIIKTIKDEFDKMKTIYIADGHHRSASSVLLAKELKAKNPNHTGKEAYNFFMSYLIPESELKIYEFNRIIKDLNGLSKEQFLTKLDAVFRIENKGSQMYQPSKKHHFCMYLDNEFYALRLRKALYNTTTALDTLDTQILYDSVLNPILGIKELRNDNRIHYSHSKSGLVTMKDHVDSGKYKIGFGLVPIDINEIKAIADEGLTMPPKSTYILPKLRSGVTIYEF